MKVQKKNRLSDMEYDEVSHVDVGAGEGAHVRLRKRDTQAGSTNRGNNPLSSGEASPSGKESRHMATEVVEKRKGRRECADCGEGVGPDSMECAECGSKNIKKSIIIVRKELTDDVSDEELGDALEAVEDDDEEDDTEDDGDEDDSEEDEEEEPAPVVEKKFSPTEASALAVDVFAVATDYANQIAKALSGGVTKDSPVEYESIMTALNTGMDSAVQEWLAKSASSKGAISKKNAGVVRQQITDIIKHATEGGVMPQHTRPASLDGLELPAEIAEYITGLEEGQGIEKKDDIFKGLTPEAAEIVRKSAEIIEENESAKWLEVAKGFKHIPGDKAELAKSLRTLHDTDKGQYDVLVKSLEGANAAAERGDITKSYGLPGGGEPSDAVSKRKATAKDLVEKGQFPTIEQAEVHLLSLDPSEYDQN